MFSWQLYVKTVLKIFEVLGIELVKSFSIPRKMNS